MIEFEQVYALKQGHGGLSSGTCVYIMDEEAELVALRSDLTKIYDMPLNNLQALRQRSKEVTIGERANKKKARQMFKVLRGKMNADNIGERGTVEASGGEIA